MWIISKIDFSKKNNIKNKNFRFNKRNQNSQKAKTEDNKFQIKPEIRFQWRRAVRRTLKFLAKHQDSWDRLRLKQMENWRFTHRLLIVPSVLSLNLMISASWELGLTKKWNNNDGRSRNFKRAASWSPLHLFRSLCFFLLGVFFFFLTVSEWWGRIYG